MIVVDTIENFPDPELDKMNRWGYVLNILFGLIGKPGASPGFNAIQNKHLVKQSFNNVLKWNFNKIIVGHGVNFNPIIYKNLNENDAETYCKSICKECWKKFM